MPLSDVRRSTHSAVSGRPSLLSSMAVSMMAGDMMFVMLCLMTRVARFHNGDTVSRSSTNKAGCLRFPRAGKPSTTLGASLRCVVYRIANFAVMLHVPYQRSRWAFLCDTNSNLAYSLISQETRRLEIIGEVQQGSVDVRYLGLFSVLLEVCSRAEEAEVLWSITQLLIASNKIKRRNSNA
jgi:hypothetical protein